VTATRQLTARGLRQRCRGLRTAILEQQLATDAEVSACWPGGGDNADRGYDGWIECYAALKSFARRIEQQDQSTAAMRDALAAAVRRAASRASVPVELSVGTRHVHAKSAWALWFLQSLDDTVRSVAVLAGELTEIAEAEELRGLPALTNGLAWRTWAWILTTEGVGMPFADAASMTPPLWTEQLLTEDYVALYLAHRSLHHDDIALMAGAFPSQGGERSRLDLGGFVAAHANEHGLRPSEIIRGWALPEVYAAAIAAAEQHRVAKANAKTREH